MKHAWGFEICIQICFGHRSENVGFGGKIILKWILKKYSGGVWVGLMYTRTDTNFRLL
jgi:hypothetical protein